MSMNAPAKVSAGKYRKRIAIRAPIDTPNTSGGASRVYTTVSGLSSVPCNIQYPPPSKKGDEVFTQQQKRSSVFTTITIRYRPSTNIDASMQAVFGTRIFDIRSVLPDDMYEKEITLQCEEVQGKGSLHS